MLDFRLLEKPLVNVPELAVRLLRHNIPTVFVTKDRNIVDEGDRFVRGLTIPVYHKQRLIADDTYLRSCINRLGGVPNQNAPPTDELTARISHLQDKELLRGLTAMEKGELKTLLARLRLDELVELEAIANSETTLRRGFDSIISEIKAITRDLKRH